MASSPPPRRTRSLAQAGALLLAGILLRTAAGANESEAPATKSGLSVNAAWPEGITYEFRKVSPSLAETKPLSYFEDIYLIGRIGARLDVDGAAFIADASLPDTHDDVTVRRARFYLVGDFRLGLPLAYKLEFSFEGRKIFLNEFFIRFKPRRWVDSVDLGYVTPPMGLENVVSSRSLTLMEVAAPVQALAPGYRSGIAVAGHWEPWRIAWKGGIFSAGQEQLNGDASDTSVQAVGRIACLPWREGPEPGAAFAHLGLSLSYVDSGKSGIHYRARPESFIAPFVLDTGDTDAAHAWQYALEGAWADGPLLISGEALQSFVAADQGGDPQFLGVYGLISWMLTGEHHPYDTRTGLFGRVEPNRPWTLLGGGSGALEIGQRLSWLDLSDAGVRGGEMLTATTGITWHLNAQLRLSANYVFAHIADGTKKSGDVSIFQARIEVGI